MWAIAATALAGFALYVALEVRENEDEAVTGAERRIIRLGRDIDRRLDRFDTRIQGAPTAADVRRLEDRLESMETRAASAEDDARSAQDRADDLERSVNRLRAAVRAAR